MPNLLVMVVVVVVETMRERSTRKRSIYIEQDIEMRGVDSGLKDSRTRGREEKYIYIYDEMMRGSLCQPDY